MAPLGRRCFREPIPEIFDAAERLKAAVAAHFALDRGRCHELIVEADDPMVRAWVAPFLGPIGRNPFIQRRFIPGAPQVLSKNLRSKARMPSSAERAALRQRHGNTCAFCGIPLISAHVRKALGHAYPGAAIWGRMNEDCHAALLCMWLQYDHLLPHSRGGSNSIENLVLACAACNYGRMEYTLEEVGLLDPREQPTFRSDWDGLEPFLRDVEVQPFRRAELS